jgi:DNA polymerase-3 subunit delta
LKEANQILLDLKRKILKPVYFLCGEESYYIDLITEYIEKNILEEADKEFNQNVVYGKDVDLIQVLGLAKQFPMMSEYQVVIVKEAQNLKELSKTTGEGSENSNKSTSSNSATAQFINYLQNPQPTTILVFAFKHKSIDKRSSLSKAIQKHAIFLETKTLYDNEIPKWITEYVTDKNYAISPKATVLLSEFLGNDLSKITNELGKLFINLPVGKEITIELIQENIGISKDYNVFELQDALAKKDILKANQIINYFASNEKENPSVLVISSLYNFFTKLLKYHFLHDKSKFAAASALGVNPYFIDGIAKAAGNYSTLKLKNIFSYLKEADLKSKGIENSSLNSGDLYKELVFKILH